MKTSSSLAALLQKCYSSIEKGTGRFRDIGARAGGGGEVIVEAPDARAVLVGFAAPDAVEEAEVGRRHEIDGPPGVKASAAAVVHCARLAAYAKRPDAYSAPLPRK